jgi:ferredoxin--NADP+ reductase
MTRINSMSTQAPTVAVIGAGPAGLFAARELANAGLQVALINRDIKAGGLAEYGIYPSKYKMKDGLRKQFRQILALPNLHYFGNVSVQQDGPLSLSDLQALGFDAILVTVGAQGTKWLGLPGEDLAGVYHAKDLVYHYNKLPPFSQQQFNIGRRIVCVGVGNVMLDIAHWARTQGEPTGGGCAARAGRRQVHQERNGNGGSQPGPSRFRCRDRALRAANDRGGARPANRKRIYPVCPARC